MLADDLIEVHATPRQVPPFSRRYPGLTAAAGYQAAAALHRHRVAAGWRALGRKIGFTNRTIWKRYGVHEPIWGFVYDRTVIRAEGNRAQIALGRLVQPRIEPEICFGLKQAPPRGAGAEALLGSIAWIAHSIEIVQCHHPDWKVTLADSTADNGLHGRLVLGSPVRIADCADLAAALPGLKVKLFNGSTLEDEGVGANVLGSPLAALAYLVEILAAQPGAPPLAAGECVTTGTLTDAHPVAPGETWRSELAGLPLPGLEIRFR